MQVSHLCFHPLEKLIMDTAIGGMNDGLYNNISRQKGRRMTVPQ